MPLNDTFCWQTRRNVAMLLSECTVFMKSYISQVKTKIVSRLTQNVASYRAYHNLRIKNRGHRARF